MNDDIKELKPLELERHLMKFYKQPSGGIRTHIIRTNDNKLVSSYDTYGKDVKKEAIRKGKKWIKETSILKDWVKTHESKNLIRYKSFEGDVLEIAKAEEVRGQVRWFIYLITKNKILDFPSNKKGGLSKVEAKKEARRYMSSRDWSA